MREKAGLKGREVKKKKKGRCRMTEVEREKKKTECKGKEWVTTRAVCLHKPYSTQEDQNYYVRLTQCNQNHTKKNRQKTWMEIHILSLAPPGIRSKVRRPVTAHCSSPPYTQSYEPPLGQQLLRKMRVFNASLWPHHEETTRERGGECNKAEKKQENDRYEEKWRYKETTKCVLC